MKNFYFLNLPILLLFLLSTTFVNSQVSLASQDFEGTTGDASNGDTWTPTISPTSYMESNGGDIWKDIPTLFSINPKSNTKFWGMRDLINPNGGGNFDHILTFPNVSVSGETNIQLSFYYQYNVFYNPWDYLKVEVFFDDVSQGVEEILTTTGSSTDWIPYVKNVPNGTSNVRFTFSAKQDGVNGYAAIDNITLKSNVVLSVKKEAIEGFAVYPNPVNNGVFNIITMNNSSKTVQIIDMLGKEVYTEQLNTNEMVDVQHLNSGVYFLRVKEDGKTSMKKLIIKK